MFEKFSMSYNQQGDTYTAKYTSNVNGKKSIEEFSGKVNDMKNTIQALLDSQAKNKEDDDLFKDFEDWDESEMPELSEEEEEELREEELKWYNKSIESAIKTINSIDPDGYNDTRVLKNVRRLYRACRQAILSFEMASSDDGIFIARR